jgi:hypothetical protein
LIQKPLNELRQPLAADRQPLLGPLDHLRGLPSDAADAVDWICQSFELSNYKRIYDGAIRPEHTHQLMEVVCIHRNLSLDRASPLFARVPGHENHRYLAPKRGAL